MPHGKIAESQKFGGLCNVSIMVHDYIHLPEVFKLYS